MILEISYIWVIDSPNESDKKRSHFFDKKRPLHLSECFQTNFILYTLETDKSLSKAVLWVLYHHPLLKINHQTKPETTAQTRSLLSMLDFRWFERHRKTSFHNNSRLWRMVALRIKLCTVRICWDKRRGSRGRMSIFFFIFVCFVFWMPCNRVLNWVSSHASSKRRK